MKNLLLITGAGASFDATNTEAIRVNKEYTPHLQRIYLMQSKATL